MFNKKIITTTLILIIISVNFIQIGSTIEIKENKNYKNKYDFPYPIVEAKNLEYDKIIIQENTTYSIYKLDYTIKNIGGKNFTGWPLTLIRNEESIMVFDYWAEDYFILQPDESINLSRDVKIKTTPNLKLIDYIDERNFADQKIVVEVNDGLKDPQNPDSNIIYAKYWNDKTDYQPTLAHLLVSTPWRYYKKQITVDNQEIYYIEMPKKNLTLNLIKRLGWINGLNTRLNDFSEKIKTVLNENNEDFVLESWDYISYALQWVINVTNCFNKTIKGTYNETELTNVFLSFKDIKNNYIALLENISMTYFGQILTSVKDLINSTEEINNWLSEKPWKKPIHLVGNVKDVKRNEKIEITSLGKTGIFYDFHDRKIDGNAEFYLKLDSWNDDIYLPKNCTISVKGSKRGYWNYTKKLLPFREWHCEKVNDSFSSIPLFSYCYPDEIISIDFTEEDWPETIKQSFILDIICRYVTWRRNK